MMAKQTRLPPQPLDNALARAVRLIVDAMPLVTIGRHRREMEQAAQTHAKEAARLRDEIYALDETMRHVRKDFHRIMATVHMPQVYVQTGQVDGPLDDTKRTRISVQYEPLWFEFPQPEKGIPRSELHQRTQYIISRAAREIAHVQADRHAEQIEKLTYHRFTKEKTNV